MSLRSPVLLTFFLFALALCAHAATISGVVRDASGSAVPGAQVTVRSGNESVAVTSDATGRFSAAISGAPVQVSVSAPGFEPISRTVIPTADLRFVLQIAASNVTVNVNASSSAAGRGEPLLLSDTPESVSIASPELLRVQPAEALDEKLRLIPGFATFRRANSRSSNPSTQGISLRGIGSSGASRALVLSDGIPLNDPFGGWVYWDRVAEVSIESVEVLRGGASHLYGSGAMGGVIQIHPFESHTGLALNTSFGSRKSPFASAAIIQNAGKFTLQLSGEGFRTDGYFLPGEGERGTSDTPASLRYGNAGFRVAYAAREGIRLYAGSSFLSETRNNGTQLQRNDTRLFDVKAGAEISLGSGTFEVNAFGSGQRFNQSFSSVSFDRNSETLTRVDGVPSQQVGGSLLWRRSYRGHNLVAGLDGRNVRGGAEGLVIATGARSTVGGQQRTIGAFAQDRLQLGSRAVLSAGLRVDTWRNYGGFTQSISPVPGTPVPLAERSENAVSPHLAVLYRLADNISINAAAFGSFRAPTLQELYRGFRVGNVVTQANAGLQAEHLAGFEIGISKRWSAAVFRVTGFWNRVTDPVANITLNVTPQLITRQRQNLGATRSAGLETESTLQLTRWLSARLAYQFADSIVTSFPADPALEGKRVPQVPRNTGSFAIIAAGRGWTGSVQLRAAGVQFDDDQNLLPLADFSSWNLYLSRQVRRGLETYVQLDNISARRYEVSRTPLKTLGPPASVSGGIRLALFR